MRTILLAATALAATGAPLAGHAALAQPSDTSGTRRPAPAPTTAPATAPSAPSPGALAAAAAPAGGPVLSLDEAIGLARKNNPEYLRALNQRRTAGARVRSAYGSLLPSADASISSQFREGRQQVFNGLPFGATSGTLSSAYDLGLTAQYNAATLIAPKLQRANQEAVEADITGSENTLRASVTQQYLTALQQSARAALQDTLVGAARVQLELAKARAAVGAGTVLDVRRAEVQVGQQEIAALQAHNLAEVETLRLFQQMGVPQPENVRLTTDFTVAEPTFALAELLETARRRNPTLNALRARESAAGLGYRSAQGEYSPTLSLRAGWGGYTSQLTDVDGMISQERATSLANQAGCFSQDTMRVAVGLPSIAGQCASLSFTPADEARIRQANRQFPFDFQRTPYTVGVALTIPVFNGFQREQRVQEAAAARSDARYSVRAQELRLTADVAAAHLNLSTSARAAGMSERNAQTAREALLLAEERYRVGANAFVDVTQARADYERAQTDRINAVYQFHRDFAALESAVGRPLR